jgi:hypothetical protein
MTLSQSAQSSSLERTPLYTKAAGSPLGIFVWNSGLSMMLRWLR